MKRTAALFAAVALVGTTIQAQAQEVTLKAVSAFDTTARYSQDFLKFIEKVNADGKGAIQIKYLGGPEVVNPLELASSLKAGIVQIASIPGAFYTNLMPETSALKASELTIQEQRKNGAFEYIDQITRERVNAKWLARQHEEEGFNIYLKQRPNSTADGHLALNGLKLRVSPLTRTAIADLGGAPVQLPPGEIYTALERGTVDGFVWTTNGIFDYGWEKLVKYRVEPTFYQGYTEILINLDVWNRLNARQRQVLEKAGIWVEGRNVLAIKDQADERRRQGEAGIQPIVLKDGAASSFLETVKAAAWKEVASVAPSRAGKLREHLTRKTKCNGGVGPHCLKPQ